MQKMMMTTTMMKMRKKKRKVMMKELKNKRMLRWLRIQKKQSRIESLLSQ